MWQAAKVQAALELTETESPEYALVALSIAAQLDRGALWRGVSRAVPGRATPYRVSVREIRRYVGSP